MNRWGNTLRYLKNPSRGQTLIMFALMVTLLFGFVGLAIDLGFAYSSRRAMQNSSDASAMAAALKIAKNISPSNTSGVGYSIIVNDSNIRDVVNEYVAANKGVAPVGANPVGITIEYLDVNKNLLATSPTADNQVPITTAMVRVKTKIEFAALFSGVLGEDRIAVGATATARIAPVKKPTTAPGPTWPLTRVFNNDLSTGTGCGASPVVFWSPNPPGDNTGDWKMLLYLGRYSAFVHQLNGATYNHKQMITRSDLTGPFANGESLGATVPPADLTGNDMTVQLQYQLRYGWNGELTVGSKYPAQTDLNLEPDPWRPGAAQPTDGDKAEVSHANLGNNIAENIKYYLNDHLEAVPDCQTTPGGGYHAYVNIYMYGLDTKEKWVGNATPKHFEDTTGNQVDRVTFVQWRTFKFYCNPSEGTPCDSALTFDGNSQIKGYMVATPIADGEPLPGPPSVEANTVQMVE